MLKLLARDRDVYDEYARQLTEEHFRCATARKALAALRDAGGDVGLGRRRRRREARRARLARSRSSRSTASGGPEYARVGLARLQEFVLKHRATRCGCSSRS